MVVDPPDRRVDEKPMQAADPFSRAAAGRRFQPARLIGNNNGEQQSLMESPMRRPQAFG
jgi:hypothetical protein